MLSEWQLWGGQGSPAFARRPTEAVTLFKKGRGVSYPRGSGEMILFVAEVAVTLVGISVDTCLDLERCIYCFPHPSYYSAHAHSRDCIGAFSP